MPHISVIIVNYNAGSHLKRCIKALLKQDYNNFDVLLVDNASTDNSLKHLPNNKSIQLIKLETNLGFAAANNLAAKQAKGEWIALLNPDAFPEKNWLTELVSATERFPEARFFGSTQICYDDPSLLDGTGDMYHILGIPARSNFHHPLSNLPETGEVFAPCAAAALYKKQVFLNAGGFDEDFFCYCEDIDLAFRLRLMGEQCIQVKEAVVKHVGSATTGKSSDFSCYHGIRNRFWVFIKNMPSPLFFILLPFHVILQDILLIRAIFQGNGRTTYEAWRDIIATFGQLWKKRKDIQKKRKAPLYSLLKAFTYSPRTLLSRSSTIKSNALKP